MAREPAVAGQFYPSDKAKLTAMIDAYVSKGESATSARGIISPHAGYVYSGAIAAETLSSLLIPERVIIFGPNHHGTGERAALYSEGYWRTPLGVVRIDAEFASKVLSRPSIIRADTLAHQFEHSLEVQIPILQYLQPNASIVPFCVSYLSYGELVEIAEVLVATISEYEEVPLIIASSDMTHFESSTHARVKDMKALEYVLNLDPEGLYRYVTDNRVSMCGVMPSVIMLLITVRLGAKCARLVRYANSGDVNGDYDSVVGYAGVVVN